MQRSAIVLAVVLLAATVVEVSAGTLANVTMPDSMQAAGTKLVLNGMGIRKKFVVKVYVAGLYLQQKSSDPNAILKADATKRLVMQFVRGVSKSQIADAFEESFQNNTPEASKTLKAEIDQLLGALESVKDGDQMIFTYVPGTGTTFAVNSQDKLTIAARDFGAVLFSVWLGPKPPNAELKKGLLGE